MAHKINGISLVVNWFSVTGDNTKYMSQIKQINIEFELSNLLFIRNSSVYAIVCTKTFAAWTNNLIRCVH